LPSTSDPCNSNIPLTDEQKFQQVEVRWSKAINKRDRYVLEFVLSPELIGILAPNKKCPHAASVSFSHTWKILQRQSFSNQRITDKTP
jgi:hypothetical protein